ncbi:hypothetical protein M9458_043796, partial [Cirrhinus mrigala]
TISSVCLRGPPLWPVPVPPRWFSKLVEGALAPLWGQGIRILNYLDDWDLVLWHLSHLGLRVNWEKSKLSPVQSISFLGMELDSVNMTARLTNERVQSMLNCLKLFRHKTAVPLKYFQRLLGHMAAAAAVGYTTESRDGHGTAVPSGSALPRNAAFFSARGWGAVCNGQAASGSWTGPRLRWHVNCLELLAVFLALCRFLPMLRHKHMLVHTDNTATVAYINPRGVYAPSDAAQIAARRLYSRGAQSSPILENGDSTP